jgi:transcription initiation factor TFIIB
MTERTRQQPTEREARTDDETEGTTDTPTVREREREAIAQETCPECEGRLAPDEKRGERACADCGLVVSAEKIDRGPEWRAFDAAERDRKARTGQPVARTMHDKGLTTGISNSNTDAKGNHLAPEKHAKLSRLRMWQERYRAQGSTERSQKQAFGEVKRMCSALGLPGATEETTCVTFRRAQEEGVLAGRSIEAVATAALYAAARQAGASRPFSSFVEVSRVDRPAIQHAYQQLTRDLGLAPAPPDPQDYVARLASTLDAPPIVETTSREILEAAEGTRAVAGKSPPGLAAAAIYAAGLVTDEKLTQKRISKAADISTVTIRDRYHELLDVWGEQS